MTDQVLTNLSNHPVIEQFSHEINSSWITAIRPSVTENTCFCNAASTPLVISVGKRWLSSSVTNKLLHFYYALIWTELNWNSILFARYQLLTTERHCFLKAAFTCLTQKHQEMFQISKCHTGMIHSAVCHICNMLLSQWPAVVLCSSLVVNHHKI